MKCETGVHLHEAGVKMQTLGICMIFRTVLEMLFLFFPFFFLLNNSIFFSSIIIDYLYSTGIDRFQLNGSIAM